MKKLTPDYVQTRLFAGARLVEIGAEFGLPLDRMSLYAQTHGLKVFATDGKLPPPDFSRADRIAIFRAKVDPVSGARRISRVSLPRITMHIAAITGQEVLP